MNSPAEPTKAATADSRLQHAICVIALFLATLGAYSNSFTGPFHFDDVSITINDPYIHSLASVTRLVQDTNRPVASLSLAANYTLSGFDTTSYHVVNFLIHIVAGLSMYGVVRRTLILPSMIGRWGKTNRWLPCAVALIWLVHPLHTESVTYITQRRESMMGMFFLLCLYCVIRGSQSRRPRIWYSAAVAACAAGMGCKEVMITAPPVILLYDRIFLSGSWAELLKRRAWLYAMFSLLALGLVFLVIAVAARSEEVTAGFSYAGCTPWEYLRTQPGVILHYLRLAFWPHPLCLDYWWPIAQSTREIVFPSIAIVSLLLASLAALWYRPPFGFLGITFFVILAPTSSIMPIADRAFEYRMYLPLAPLATIIVVGGYIAGSKLVSDRGPLSRVFRVLGAVVFLATAAGLGVLTYMRNGDYQSAICIWRDTVEKAPHNPRAFCALGGALKDRGKVDEAIANYEEALRLDPKYVDTYYLLGETLYDQGRVDEAMKYYHDALRVNPQRGVAHLNLANVLRDQGKTEEAMEHYHKAIAIQPKCYAAHNNLGNIFKEQGKMLDALVQYQRAMRIKPYDAALHNNIGNALVQQGRIGQAIVYFEKAVGFDPRSAPAHDSLAHALAETGKIDKAIMHCRKALAIREKEMGKEDPEYAESLNNLALLHQAARDYARAESLCREATRILRDALGAENPRYVTALHNQARLYRTMGEYNRAESVLREIVANAPDDVQAYYLLGVTLYARGKEHEAVRQWREALRLQPDQVSVLGHMAWVLATNPDASIRNGAEAVELAERAMQLPDGETARVLDALAAAYAEVGRFSEAVETAEQALEMLPATNRAFAAAIRKRLELYRKESVFRDSRD